MQDTTLRNEAVSTGLVPGRTARRVLAVAAFAVATAVGARISVPVPFSPVPMTLQTMVVLLSGALLGARLGAFAQLSYLGAGIAGLPVFTAGAGLAYLLGPTGGYLLAFPAAAFAAGLLTHRVRRTGWIGAATLYVALFAASLVVLAGGAAWLGVLTGDFSSALALGIVPFLMGDVVKVALATLITWRGRDKALRLL